MSTLYVPPRLDISPGLLWHDGWEDPARAERYARYQGLYDTDAKAHRVIVEGGGTEVPLVIPDARTIVDRIAHYWTLGLELSVVPATAQENGAAAATRLAEVLRAFLEREEWEALWAQARPGGATKGDIVLHLTADPARPAGGRVSLTDVQPEAYHPILDRGTGQLLAVYLVDRVDSDGAGDVLRRVAYEYRLTAGPDGRPVRRVYREDGLWTRQIGAAPRFLRWLLPPGLLPEEITAIPVYHIRNRPQTGRRFGVSDLSGLESILTGASQRITDDDLALSLEGQGLYVTSATEPRNGWAVAPRSVLQVADVSQFTRVPGVTSLGASHDHLTMIREAMFSSTGLTPAARGELADPGASGIALTIRFTPLLAAMHARDAVAVGRLRQLWWDWRAWMRAYDPETMPPAVADAGAVALALGDKVPVNRAEVVREVVDLYAAGLLSGDTARGILRDRLGLTIPADEFARIVAERTALRDAEDPLAALDRRPPGDPVPTDPAPAAGG